MSTKDYKQTLEAVLEMKIAQCATDSPYKEGKYTYGDYLEGLNEGYISGMKEALRTLKASEFLVEV